ncbi:unnamed protein product [Acanthoscelides obtectus]|uniref:Mutator-like transposase domain-containing protein n=1 Tax=Acanthoscelides obtectus TaxID=200917 RepID=A0A9P0LMJ8_ACAOB|nr:unnamed protein product [Acanthoscelides obtectus]CAK1627347.1 hypothetical protein AOBTE_LOCUS4540 [Acanthoscelides obtectus]
MSTRTYDKLHAEICEAWKQKSVETMKNAADEERALAMTDGQVDANGVPLITVVADGSWAKRSYHSNYSSLSGAAAIIGYKTKLFLGVRNKYCTICKIAERANMSLTKPHKCFKNWTGSSSSMEADITAEGFSKSLAKYMIS